MIIYIVKENLSLSNNCSTRAKWAPFFFLNPNTLLELIQAIPHIFDEVVFSSKKAGGGEEKIRQGKGRAEEPRGEERGGQQRGDLYTRCSHIPMAVYNILQRKID